MSSQLHQVPESVGVAACAHERQRRRDATESSVRSMLPALGLDELRVLERMAERMVRHKPEYGELVLARDGRDFIAEAAAEHQDAVFYLLVDEIIRNDQRLERLRCEGADDLAKNHPVEHALREFAANAASLVDPAPTDLTDPSAYDVNPDDHF